MLVLLGSDALGFVVLGKTVGVGTTVAGGVGGAVESFAVLAQDDVAPNQNGER